MTPPNMPILKRVFAVPSFLAALSLLVTACSYLQSQPQPSKIKIPQSFGYPNGITHLPNGDLLVGSVVSGDILLIEDGAEPSILFKETDDLFAGTALRFDPRTNLLWVASPDFLSSPDQKRPHRLAAVDLGRKSVVWSMAVPDEGFANDMVLDGKGGIYISDSLNGRVLHLSGPGAPLTVVAQSPLLNSDAIGPAGIAKTASGDLIVGLYSDGLLFRVGLDKENSPELMQIPKLPRVEKLKLTSTLQNPDGMMMLEGDRLLLLEGAVASGSGKLLAINLNDTPPLEPTVLLDQLESPLNLTRFQNRVYLTESRIRHRLLPESNVPQPDAFFVVKHELQDVKRPQPVRIKLPDKWFPESIANSKTGHLFTGSATDGAILKTHISSGISEVFLASGGNGLMSVQGLLVDESDGLLYVCTANLGVHKTIDVPSALLAFDLASGNSRGRWPLGDNGLCNDLTQLGAGQLLVTDSLNNRILMFDPKTNELRTWLQHSSLDQGEIKSNGIAYSEKDQAVFVTLFSAGALLKIDVDSNLAPIAVNKVDLPRSLDSPDAVRLVAPGRLLVFENGLLSGEGGAVSSIVVTGNKGRIAPLYESDFNPTSGVLIGGQLWMATSQFAYIFGNRKQSTPEKFELKAIELPEGF